MDNIFTTNKNVYGINTFGNGTNIDIQNSMYRVELTVDYGQENNGKEYDEAKLTNTRKMSAIKSTYKFDEGEYLNINTKVNTDNNKYTSKPTKVVFYVDQNDMPSFNFDANIEEGFKTAFVNLIEEKINGSIGKYTKFAPNTYYSPMADENTRKIYTSGGFKDISFKFRLYDRHYMKINVNDDSVTYGNPLTVFSLLSSCIFPFGNEGEGGKIDEIITSLFHSLDFLDGLTTNTKEVIVDKIMGVKDGNILKSIFDTMKKRFHGCPIIRLHRLGDRIFEGESIWEFFLTNFSSSFSKDLIFYESLGIYKPIYIDFEITLSPTFIPSIEKMENWLLYNGGDGKEENKLGTKIDNKYTYDTSNMLMKPIT